MKERFIIISILAADTLKADTSMKPGKRPYFADATSFKITYDAKTAITP